jgi:hypothetical protein
LESVSVGCQISEGKFFLKNAACIADTAEKHKRTTAAKRRAARPCDEEGERLPMLVLRNFGDP